MIIYGTGEYKLSNPKLHTKSTCPECGEKEVTFHFFKKYFHLFWIPTFPFGERNVAFCEKCHASYQESIPASIKPDMENAKSRVSFAYHLFSGLAVLVIGIGLIIFLNDGKTTYHYPSGNKQAIGKMVLNKPEGEWTYYFENGKIQSVQNYNNGLEEGHWTWFNEEGFKTKEGNYKKGMYDGSWLFYDEKGNLTEESIFVDNRKQGIAVVYHPNGKKAAEGKFERDREQGKWTYWYDNENLMLEGNFNEGTKTGTWKSYFDNGKLYTETEYRDSVEYYISIYDSAGIQTVANGEGTHTGYYANHQKSFEGKIRNGINDGRWSFWYENGNPKETASFIDGKYILESSFDANGNMMVIGGNGYHKTFYLNGIVQSECLYRNGLPNGLMLTRDVEGNLVSEVNYKNGKYHGEYKYYQITGELQSSGSFKENHQEGVWTWYHLSGGKEAEVTYVNGIKEGEEIFWSESGDIVKREHYKGGVLVKEE